MGKDKLKRFKENLTFSNLIQPKVTYPTADSELKGNWNRVFFKNNNPIVLELGCGRGEYTLALAAMHPEKNYIGVDWKGARLWRGAKTAMESSMLNVGFLRIQIQTIKAFFSNEEIEEIWITFPDPKLLQSDERKRLTSPRFLNFYKELIIPGGVINLKTDSKDLYDYTIEQLSLLKSKILFASDDIYSTHSEDGILSVKTTYEKMWLKDGSKICYIRFILNE
jgi:tRNA (guanine-N7-)-methyltransferase